MGKIIAIANQKGGVGKTTTAINLAAAVGAAGKSVLLIDNDPQGNTTSGLGITKKNSEFSSYDILVRDEPIEKAVIETKYKNVSVIIADMDYAAAEIELVEMQNRTSRLKMKLSKIADRYDFIFIDCPPSLGLITLNALSACDSVLVPIQCEFYALEGLAHLMTTVRKVKRLYNPYIELEGVLLTMYDKRLNLTSQVVRNVKKHFPGKVFKSVIPRNVRLSEAPSFGMPVIYYDPSSKGASSYKSLALELIANNK